jgi:hypothetical protein
MNESLAASGSHMRLLTWAKHFLRHLLSITHRQWLYHNAKIHIRKLEGKTEREHVDIIEEVRDMMLVDPDEELLPCHRHLLEQDFLQLGEGTSVNSQYWLAQMNLALLAVEEPRRRQVTPLATIGTICTRATAGLDITTMSNLAKRTRL